MFVGRIGVIKAARIPATVLVLSNGRIQGAIKDNRLLSAVNLTIGNFHMEGAIALFDTGSSESVLFLQDTRTKIGHGPYDTGLVVGFGSNLKKVEYYEAKLELPGQSSLHVDLLDVYDGPAVHADIIIGMDIIRKGKLTVDGLAGMFVFEI